MIYMMNSWQDDKLTERIIGLAMRVHRRLGPGFLETVYRRALLVELHRAGIGAEEEEHIAVTYDDVVVGTFVADITVDARVILELKAVSVLRKAHEVQLVNYLTATRRGVGLLINFGGESLQIKRKYRQRRKAIRSPDAESAVHHVNHVNPVQGS